MEQSEFDKTVSQLKKLHMTIGIGLTIAVLGFLFAPISTYFADGGMPYYIKSALIMLIVVDIPVFYKLYKWNVIETEMPQEEKQENFLKWSYIRMAFWAINVLLCVLVYHFDSDALEHKLCSSLYLCVFCLAFYLFLGKVNEEDLNK